MATSWNDVVSNPDFQALSPDQKDVARYQYFNDVVAPQVPQEDLHNAWQQFADYSRPNVVEDVQKSLVRGVAKGLEDLPTWAADFGNTIALGEKKAYEYYRDISGNPLTSQQEQKMEVASPFYSSEQIQDYLDIPRVKSQPSTSAGEIAQDIGEFGGNFVAPFAGKAAKSLLSASAENASQTAADIAAGKTRSYEQVQAANDALGDNTNALYKQASDLGANLNPQASEAAASYLRQYVEDAANNGVELDPDMHKQTNSALNNFEKKSENGLQIESIENTRKQLNKIISGNPEGSPGANDGYAARQALRGIDNIYDNMQNNPYLLESGTSDSVDALKAARAAHSLESRHDTITDIMRRSNGNPNQLQNEFKSLYDDQNQFEKFAPEDQTLIKDIAHPDRLVSSLKTLGKAAPGSNGYVNAAEIGGLLSMNPIAQGLALAGGLGGMTANLIRSRIINGSVDQLLRNMEERSIGIDTTLGNKGFSPIINETKTLPASTTQALPSAQRPMITDYSGNTRPMTDQEWLESQSSSNLGITSADERGVPSPGRSPQLPRTTPYTNVPLQQMGNIYRQQSVSPTNVSDLHAASRGLPSPQQGEGFIAGMEGIRPRTQAEEFAVSPEAMTQKQAVWDAQAARLQANGYSDNEIANRLGQRPSNNRGTDAEADAMETLKNLSRKHGGAVPSPAQIKAGNYKKEHIKIHGLDISIENKKGSTRAGMDKDGKEWHVKMPAHYGYIKGTVGADKDHVDCYIGDHPKSNRVYIINQHHLDTGKWDEHKCMIGFSSRDEALSTYKAGFSDGKGKQRIGSISYMDINEFKNWLKNGNTRKAA